MELAANGAWSVRGHWNKFHAVQLKKHGKPGEALQKVWHKIADVVDEFDLMGDEGAGKASLREGRGLREAAEKSPESGTSNFFIFKCPLVKMRAIVSAPRGASTCAV